MNKKKVKSNGVENVLSEGQQKQRLEIVELELKARYWKAQFEIRDYTLKCEAVQPAYNEYLEKEAEKMEQLKKEWEENLKKLKENGATVDGLLGQAEEKMIDVPITQEILDMNPEMVDEGLKIGDIIQVSEESDLTPEEAEKEFEEQNK